MVYSVIDGGAGVKIMLRVGGCVTSMAGKGYLSACRSVIDLRFLYIRGQTVHADVAGY